MTCVKNISYLGKASLSRHFIPFRTSRSWFTYIHLFQCKPSKIAKEIKKMVIILGPFDGYFTTKPDSYMTRNSEIDKPFQRWEGYQSYGILSTTTPEDWRKTTQEC